MGKKLPQALHLGSQSWYTEVKKPGYVVQYWLSDVDIQDCLIDYCKFWVNKNITLVERRPKC